MLQCEECPAAFKDKSSFYHHRTVNHGYANYACSACDLRLPKAAEMASHALTAHDATAATCASCAEDVEFGANPDVFATHFLTCVNNKGRVRRLKAKERKQELLKAGKLAANSFQCEACGKTLKSKKELKDHTIVAHTKQYPYNCEHCDFRTVVKQSFQKHQLIHIRAETEDASLFVFCHICAKRFTDKGVLGTHIRNVHDKNYRIRKCPECPEEFRSYPSYQRHIITKHSTDPKYQCPQCPFRGAPSDLRTHMEHHEPPKFKCGECGKALRTQNSLISHQRIHSGENPFKLV